MRLTISTFAKGANFRSDFPDAQLPPLAAKADDIPYHMNHIKNGKEVKKLRFDIPDGIHANHPAYDSKVEGRMQQIWSELKIEFNEKQISPQI